MKSFVIGRVAVGGGKLLVLVLAGVLLFLLEREARAGERQLIDSQGKTAWLYTPTEEPVAGKTYWLVVGVHGVGADGKGACGAADWAKAFDDVIVLGPTFEQGRPATQGVQGAGGAQGGAATQATQSSTTRAGAGGGEVGGGAATRPTTRVGGMPSGAYQMSGPAHEAKLKALIAEVGKTWKLHPKIVVHGFSAGAQFAHRFAMRNPEMVAGVSAHSAGSWAKLEGADRINPAARGIPFVLSCGEEDTGRGGPEGTPTRIEGVKRFAADLKSLGFEVELRTWPGVKHEFSPGLMPLAKELMVKVRG